jgi:hypothetical protein
MLGEEPIEIVLCRADNQASVGIELADREGSFGVDAFAASRQNCRPTSIDAGSCEQVPLAAVTDNKVI